jgi:hypothetical protein
MRIPVVAVALVASLAAACSSSSGPTGEPADGDVVLTIKGQTEMPMTGAAIADANDPADMLVVIGTSGIDCTFDPMTFFHLGVYAQLHADKTTPGTDADAEIDVVDISNNGGLNYDGDGSSGAVTIDTIADRVTGSVTFSYASDSDGTVSANGSFDVKRCF